MEKSLIKSQEDHSLVLCAFLKIGIGLKQKHLFHIDLFSFLY